jgi:hypothetical protein
MCEQGQLVSDDCCRRSIAQVESRAGLPLVQSVVWQLSHAVCNSLLLATVSSRFKTSPTDGIETLVSSAYANKVAWQDEADSYRIQLHSRIELARLVCDEGNEVLFLNFKFVVNHLIRRSGVRASTATGFIWLVHAIGCGSGTTVIRLRDEKLYSLVDRYHFRGTCYTQNMKAAGSSKT